MSGIAPDIGRPSRAAHRRRGILPGAVRTRRRRVADYLRQVL